MTDAGRGAAVPADPEDDGNGSTPVRPAERLGIVSYANVAPLHHGLLQKVSTDAGRVTFVHGVPSELNASLLAGDIDLTLISSIEFLRHRDRLVALPDFSIATIGPVHSVMLFHSRPWKELDGGRIAVSDESATSVELLRVLLQANGMEARFVRMPPDLDSMLDVSDAALLIGDTALSEALAHRELACGRPYMTDLGEAWYRETRLPFTFAVWASPEERRPSHSLVRRLREARERGLGDLSEVAAREGAARGVEASAMQRYLSNFRYYLELPDRDGLAEFGRRALPAFDPGQLRFWDL